MKTRMLYTAGFTLIEAMVALGIFAMIITITVGAFLVLIASNQTVQGDQTVSTNLTFLLDSMTREIRTGTGYYCAYRPNTNGGPAFVDDIFNDVDNIPLTETRDCVPGVGQDNVNHRYRGISFVETGGSITGTAGGNRISYYYNDEFDDVDGDGVDDGMLFRKVGSNPAEQMISGGVVLEEVRFTVTGGVNTTGASGGDIDRIMQPSVTIAIIGRNANASTTPFRIQTTVSQRRLDL